MNASKVTRKLKADIVALPVVLTIGHSTHPLDEFVGLLRGTRCDPCCGRAHGAALFPQSTVQQNFAAKIIKEGWSAICTSAGTRRFAPCQARFHQHGMAKNIFSRLCRLHADSRVR